MRNEIDNPGEVCSDAIIRSPVCSIKEKGLHLLITMRGEF